MIFLTPASLARFSPGRLRDSSEGKKQEARHLSQWKKEAHTWRATQTKGAKGGKTVSGEETASQLLLVYKVNLLLDERDTVAAAKKLRQTVSPSRLLL